MQLLLDNGFGVDPEDYSSDLALRGLWPIYYSRHPDRPDDVIRITDPVGRSFGYLVSTGDMVEYPGIQIMIRSATYESGYRKANEIAIFLDRAFNQITRIVDPLGVTGTGTTDTGTGTDDSTVTYEIHGFNRTTNVFSLGSDVPQGKRELFVINGLLTLRQCCN